MDTAQIFTDVFPIASRLTTLELFESREDEEAVFLTLRLLRWEARGEDERSIQDIKEQEVRVLSAKEREDPRLAACIAGWAAAVLVVFERDDDEGKMIETMMPADLVVIHKLLELKRPRTPDQFTDAALGQARLGKFVKQ